MVADQVKLVRGNGAPLTRTCRCSTTAAVMETITMENAHDLLDQIGDSNRRIKIALTHLLDAQQANARCNKQHIVDDLIDRAIEQLNRAYNAGQR